MDVNWEEIYQIIVEQGTSYGMNVLGALIILIIGFWIAGRVRNVIRKTFAKYEKLDVTLGSFFASLARYTIIAITIIAVLNKFGVETTSLLALLGAAGLAIGLALQGTLSNLAAGVMLMVFRPFKVGDFVEVAGQAGTVKEINLFVTEMATGDNVQKLLPNSSIWGSTITNFSANDTRRVDFVFGIGYGSSIDVAMETILKLIQADDRVHKDPEPFMAVSNLGDSSVDITVRVWCDKGDYWPIKFALTKAVKEAFDKEGVDIPYPTQTLNVVKEA